MRAVLAAVAAAAVLAPAVAGEFRRLAEPPAASAAAIEDQEPTLPKIQDRIPHERPAPRPRAAVPWSAALDAAIARHAAANGVPLTLARRVVLRESSGNPRAVSKGNYGLMQIRLGTARAMGYRGDAKGLLDPHTNMTYAMRYLAGALRAASGNHERAIALYARGYYPEAKRMGFSPYDPPRAVSSSAGSPGG